MEKVFKITVTDVDGKVFDFQFIDDGNQTMNLYIDGKLVKGTRNTFAEMLLMKSSVDIKRVCGVFEGFPRA